MKLGYFKKIYERFLKIRGTPREIGLGFALGIFIGFSPILGFHMVLGIFAASLFKWNKIAALIGVQITNIFTAPIIYSFTYRLGAKFMGIDKSLIIGGEFDFDILISILRKTPEILTALIIGGIIIGIPSAFAGYFIAFKAVKRYQDDLKMRIQQKAKFIRQKVRISKKK